MIHKKYLFISFKKTKEIKSAQGNISAVRSPKVIEGKKSKGDIANLI